MLTRTYIPRPTLPAALLKPLQPGRKLQLFQNPELQNPNSSLLLPNFIFQQVAIENLGPLNVSAVNFLSEVGRRLTSLSGDSRETSFLFQLLSMLIQRFNSALIMDSCFSDEDPDL